MFSSEIAFSVVYSSAKQFSIFRSSSFKRGRREKRRRKTVLNRKKKTSTQTHVNRVGCRIQASLSIFIQSTKLRPVQLPRKERKTEVFACNLVYIDVSTNKLGGEQYILHDSTRSVCSCTPKSDFIHFSRQISRLSRTTGCALQGGSVM